VIAAPTFAYNVGGDGGRDAVDPPQRSAARGTADT
jgi:hypothetical protein